MTNDTIAQHLCEYAQEMDRCGSLFRARSYRAAAFAIARLQRPLGDIFRDGGRAALEAIPGIGLSMAYTIEMLLTTGEFRVLREPGPAERALLTLPGVGPRLAETLRDRLGVSTLEGLRDAARGGRLLKYVGRDRLRGIVAAVEARLLRERCPVVPDEPAVEDLLDVDSAFRLEGARQAKRGVWSLRASAANTALAHRLGATGDWVMIEFDRGGDAGQRTVVTETSGELLGRRVVRGREAECRRVAAAAA